ncbi:hypothetical protein EDD15DRAFT_2323632 [Pisolithus albus]|nr:hypothetical protein EDD15DRAFT_2323632 [Pisolithus albus]
MDICLGMKVMVTENVETELDITNGARGTISGIICHPEETANIEENDTVTLAHLPLYVLVKMDRTRTSKLTDLDESVIPIEPATRTFRIKIKQQGKEISRANTALCHR